MGVSIHEIALVTLTTFAAGVLARRVQQPWLMGVPAMIAVISCCTPADAASTLVISVPCCSLYVAVVFRTGVTPTRAEDV